MRDIVMMAVHDLVGGRERRNSPRRTSRLENRVHHQLAVEARVALRPTYSVDVFVEVLCPFFEIGEIAVGHIADEMPHVLFRKLYKVAADSVADSARTAMQHQPDSIALVEAYFDEMVARTESAEMRTGMSVAREFLMLRGDLPIAPFE